MKCQHMNCQNSAVVQVEIQAITVLKKWVCNPHYTELKTQGAIIQILDDVGSRNERIMQDRMMGGR